MKRASKGTGGSRYFIGLFRDDIIDNKVTIGELCELSKFGSKYVAVYFGSNYEGSYIFYMDGKFQLITGATESFIRVI